MTLQPLSTLLVQDETHVLLQAAVCYHISSLNTSTPTEHMPKALFVVDLLCQGTSHVVHSAPGGAAMQPGHALYLSTSCPLNTVRNQHLCQNES